MWAFSLGTPPRPQSCPRRQRGVRNPVARADGQAVREGQAVAPAVLLLLNTGLRPGEAMALKWADLDSHTLPVQRVLVRKPNGAYHVVGQKAKTEQSLRAVTLSKCVVEALKEHRARQVEEMLAYGQR